MGSAIIQLPHQYSTTSVATSVFVLEALTPDGGHPEVGPVESALWTFAGPWNVSFTGPLLDFT